MIPAELMYEGWEGVVLRSTGFEVKELVNLPFIDVAAYQRILTTAMKALYSNHPFAGEKL